MNYFVSMAAAIAVFVVMRAIGAKMTGSRDEDTVKSGKLMRVASWPLLVVWALGHTFYGGVYQIPAGNVGVIYEFGAIKSQMSEGLQMTAPWRTVAMANVQVQGHKFLNLRAFSSETQDVMVDATLNIRVSPDTIQNLYRRVGPGYFDTVIAPRVAQNFKDETVKYKSVDIAPNRESIRQAVRDRLEKELSPYSIEVVDLLLDNIDFLPGFKSAIEEKQIATQHALEEEQKVMVERHRAEQQVEKARGEGNSILAVAEKQAEANKKLTESLSPELIQYTMVQKLSDKIQVLMIPPGANFILGSEILKKKDDGEKK